MGVAVARNTICISRVGDQCSLRDNCEEMYECRVCVVRRGGCFDRGREIWMGRCDEREENDEISHNFCTL
jgi:hypothetical protein